jgi:hypothetical protein
MRKPDQRTSELHTGQLWDVGDRCSSDLNRGIARSHISV